MFDKNQYEKDIEKFGLKNWSTRQPATEFGSTATVKTLARPRPIPYKGEIVRDLVPNVLVGMYSKPEGELTHNTILEWMSADDAEEYGLQLIAAARLSREVFNEYKE